MLRRTLILALIVVIAVGIPTTILAQDPFSVGSISGRAIDVAGRGVAAQAVELLQGTRVVRVGKTSAAGEWSFRDVKPGDYVVRVNVKGKLSGVRVSIIGGQIMSDMVIVVSTASVSPQLGSVASLLAAIAPSAAAVAVQTATVQAIEDTETTQLNDQILEAILQDMSPTERVAFANAVLEAVAEAGPSNSPFSQYVVQLQQIVVTQGQSVPDFPPPTSVS